MNPGTKDRLTRFADLLTRWNATLNLVAPRDIQILWERHIEDSLQLLPLIPPGTQRGIDLGTGGGFPGLVLAIAAGIPFDLVESDRRKAAFLRTAVQETGASAAVHATRIERSALPPAPLVTARALAPLVRLLPLAEPLLAQGGTLLLLKGAAAEQEIVEAAAWDMTVGCIPSRTGGGGTILRITRLARR